MFFDKGGMDLRSRFGDIEIVTSANSLKIPARTSWEAVEQAMRNQEFNLGRAMVFGILGKNIAHSLGLYNNGEGEYYWLDPNYGVWSMKQPGVVAAMKYLFDETGEPEEKGVYQVRGGGKPDGFEYSVWDLKTDSL
jgi:hypothetical protein